MTKDDALNRKAENARELGLDYEPEPVAWMCADKSLINKGYARFSHVCMGDWKIPVYTIPPQRTWVGLTDEDIALIDWESLATKKDCVQAIEAKLKELNT